MSRQGVVKSIIVATGVEVITAAIQHTRILQQFEAPDCVHDAMRSIR
jgi:hypothetical protein